MPLHRLIALDRFLQAWVVSHRAPVLDVVFLAISGAGYRGIGWLAIAVLVAARRRAWRRLAIVAVALLLAAVSSDLVLKNLIVRARPFAAPGATVRVIGPRPHDSSFPSGHSTSSFAGATALALTGTPPQFAWLVGAALVGYSRVYLGVHYPSDVVGGAILGALCAWAAIRLMAAATRH